MTGRHQIPWRMSHQLRLLQGAAALFADLVQAVDQSVHEVRMETYIFNFDATGQAVAQALIRAARRGVAVYLVMDGVGTAKIPDDWATQWDAAGVQWRIFRPLGYVGLLIPSHWRRMHRKLCVVDGQVAYCGGINVLDDWFDPNHGPLDAPRFDFAVAVKGPLVRAAHEVMTQFWWRMEAAREARNAELAASWSDLQQAVRLALVQQHEEPATLSAAADRQLLVPMQARADLLLRDNVRHRNDIERAYRKAIAEARREIIIANAYFLPGRKLRQALIHAVRRGVRVRLLLQGRYEYFMQYHAVRMVYGVLLGSGVEIHEYTPSFLHAKVAVVDGRWATVGSSNLDPFSLLLAREANVVVDDVPFAEQLRASLLQTIAQHGRLVEPLAYVQRSWSQRWLDLLAFGLMRLGILLLGKRY